MNKFKKVIRLGLILAMSIAMSVTSFAHSGRTDSNGGHHDYKNKSGLGSYHYHCGGYPAHLHENGVCPYSSAAVTTSTTSYKKSTTSTQPVKSAYTVKQQAFNLAGKAVWMNTILKDGVSLVELKTFADGLGISLEYNATISNVIARYNGKYVSLLIGSKSAKANGESTTLAVAPIEKDGRTYVPARYIAEAFGMQVSFDSSANVTCIIK